MKIRSANFQTLLTLGQKYGTQIKKAVLLCLAVILSFSFTAGSICKPTDDDVLACETELREYIENPEDGIDTSTYTLTMDGSVVKLSVHGSGHSATATRTTDGSYHYESSKGLFEYYVSFLILWGFFAVLLYYFFYFIVYLIINGVKWLCKSVKKLCREYNTTKTKAVFDISQKDAEEYPDTGRKKAAYDDGYKKGYEEGFNDGRNAGFEQGLSDVYAYTYDEGYGCGYVDGINYAKEHLCGTDVAAPESDDFDESDEPTE